MGRTLHRHEQQEMLDQARQQSHSWQGRRDRKRRQQIIGQSFADAANNHGFKRLRWRRLWRQQIQDYMIAAIQNLRLLVKHGTIQWPAEGPFLPACSNILLPWPSSGTSYLPEKKKDATAANFSCQ
jgi:hypothetical protein